MEQEERMRPGELKEYNNEHIVVSWEPAFCIHTANCFNAEPEVPTAAERTIICSWQSQVRQRQGRPYP